MYSVIMCYGFSRNIQFMIRLKQCMGDVLNIVQHYIYSVTLRPIKSRV
jgi:hypothetical protein